MRINPQYPIGVALLSLMALTVGCSEPGRTRIFVSPTPPGTAEAAGPQTTSSDSPAQVISPPVSTAVPTPFADQIIVAGTPTPEPTTADRRSEEPTAEPTNETAGDSTPEPRHTIAPVPTATLHPTPTLTPAPKVPPTPAPAGLIIQCIFFDGLVTKTESDEYVQVLNQGPTAVNLLGWRLVDQSDESPEFTFPSYELQPQASVRVYTDEDHAESGGFSFQRKSSIWNNSSPDTAALINPAGATVSTNTYPPGC